LFLSAACTSIPRETVDLSSAIGYDLSKLKTSHINLVQHHYSQILEDVDRFIEEKYSPTLINHVLKQELDLYRSGDYSIYGVLVDAGGENAKKEQTDLALKEMTDFIEAANEQVELKRIEIAQPIMNQRDSLLSLINNRYTGLISANATVTGYLESIRDVKDAQKNALNKIGLGNSDELISEKLELLSSSINSALNQAADIDLKSDDALEKFEEVIQKLKK
jgi:hypothetical protein